MAHVSVLRGENKMRRATLSDFGITHAESREAISFYETRCGLYFSRDVLLHLYTLLLQFSAALAAAWLFLVGLFGVELSYHFLEKLNFQTF